ncbi:hypothetical protein [Clostridium butyricum]|uniref:hypothetical protein n=1 Tax=Clostridium butyricum TaxID=1492 RepID=UPI00374FB4CC
MIFFGGKFAGNYNRKITEKVKNQTLLLFGIKMEKRSECFQGFKKGEKAKKLNFKVNVHQHFIDLY